MLVLTRKTGQALTIALGSALDPATPIGELFHDGPIEILVMQVDGARVKLGILADSRLLILRNELFHPKV